MDAPIPKSMILVSDELIPGLPEDPIMLLKGFSQAGVIIQLAALNYRLRSFHQMYSNTEFDKQLKEIDYFFEGNPEVKLRLKAKLSELQSEYKSVCCLSRQTALYAMEEILSAKDVLIKDRIFEPNLSVLFVYLMAVNKKLTKKEAVSSNPLETLESLNSALLVLNEIDLPFNPLFSAYRGIRFFEYLQSTTLNEALIAYIDSEYNTTFDEFIYEISSMAFANKHPQGFNFKYDVKPSRKDLFEKFSRRHDNHNPYSLLNIRKSPFFKIGESSFILLNYSSLLEKCYSQFINDFWYDKVKGFPIGSENKPMNAQQYWGLLGNFLERYADQALRPAFSNEAFVYKALDELKVKTKQGLYEIADIYIRAKNKIILIQIKVTTIFDKQRFSDSLEDLYGGDRTEFFERIGVNQLVKTIINFRKYVSMIDSEAATLSNLQIYPCLLLNDRAFQTPLFPNLINERFKEVLSDYNDSVFTVEPVSTLHVTDVEAIEDSLAITPEKIWEILAVNTRANYIPPFYNSINALDIRPTFKKVQVMYEDLIANYYEKHAKK